MTQILVTSASGANGDGFGALLSFTADGEPTGHFSDDQRIADPRGLTLDPAGELVYLNCGGDRTLALDQQGNVVLDSGQFAGLDPGGALFGPDGRYYLSARRRRTIMTMPALLDREPQPLLPEAIVPFPRGFAFAPDGEQYLSSGVGPSGAGDNTIAVFDRSHTLRVPRLVDDPELSPLDLTIAPNGNIVVASEWPFGSPDATATIREYDPATGKLVRVFSPGAGVGFARPRGLRFGPDGGLYCVGKEHVVGFDFATGKFLGVAVRLPRLYGQALVFLP